MQKLLAACLFAVLAVGCQKSDPTQTAEAKTEHKAEAIAPLTVDEVDTQLAAHQITPVDVNGDQLRKKLGVVPGAILLTDDEGFAPSELPADKSTKLVFYCHDEG
jgi:hypothetical protein